MGRSSILGGREGLQHFPVGLFQHWMSPGVTRGLDPRVHPFFATIYCCVATILLMDARVRPAHDDLMRVSTGGMLYWFAFAL
jgi:hypothetical protein